MGLKHKKKHRQLWFKRGSTECHPEITTKSYSEIEERMQKKYNFREEMKKRAKQEEFLL